MGLSGSQHSLQWWTAYNHLKHSDIDCLDEGSLSNVIYGFGALTLLYLAILARSSIFLDDLTTNIFHYIGFSDDKIDEDYIFPKSSGPINDPLQI